MMLILWVTEGFFIRDDRIPWSMTPHCKAELFSHFRAKGLNKIYIEIWKVWRGLKISVQKNSPVCRSLHSFGNSSKTQGLQPSWSILCFRTLDDLTIWYNWCIWYIRSRWVICKWDAAKAKIIAFADIVIWVVLNLAPLLWHEQKQRPPLYNHIIM